jgi:hypothetical protein
MYNMAFSAPLSAKGQKEANVVISGTKVCGPLLPEWLNFKHRTTLTGRNAAQQTIGYLEYIRS